MRGCRSKSISSLGLPVVLRSAHSPLDIAIDTQIACPGKVKDNILDQCNTSKSAVRAQHVLLGLWLLHVEAIGHSSLVDPYHVACSQQHQRSCQYDEQPELLRGYEVRLVLGLIRRLCLDEA